MSLPRNYEHHLDYFESALEFLSEYSWIYRTSNTCFIKENVLDQIPNEWIQYFLNLTLNDLNSFPFKKLCGQPYSMQTFYDQLKNLSPNYNNDASDPGSSNCENLMKNSTKNVFKEVSVKKNHEILRLSEAIIEFFHNKIELNERIDIIIDFGCGLGYLSQILFERTNYKVLGIEHNGERVNAAIKRQQKYYPSSKGYVNFVQHKITNNSCEFILNKIKEFYPEYFSNNDEDDGQDYDKNSPRLGIVGLHTCADLFITTINLFFALRYARKLVCMPCCYHKFQIVDNNVDSTLTAFKQFPISKEFIAACNRFHQRNTENQIRNFLNRPFLRLACQQRASRWKNMNEIDHRKHGMEMFMRGIAECLIKNADHDDEFIVKVKNHPKASRSDVAASTEINFIDIESHYEIRSKLSKMSIEWNDTHKQAFATVLSKYANGDKLAEILTCLQQSMQEFCENLVLLDRICYINNKNVHTNTKLCKIMDDSISPRCFAILSHKINEKQSSL